MQTLLNSIIKSRITKQKIRGGTFIQVSDYGLTDQLNIRFKTKDGKLIKTKEEYEQELQRNELQREVQSSNQGMDRGVRSGNHQIRWQEGGRRGSSTSSWGEEVLSRPSGSSRNESDVTTVIEFELNADEFQQFYSKNPEVKEQFLQVYQANKDISKQLEKHGIKATEQNKSKKIK